MEIVHSIAVARLDVLKLSGDDGDFVTATQAST
jgi:hypothetical protein